MTEQQNTKKSRSRAAVIMGILAKHNFYANGFTPYELRTTLEDLGPTYVKIGQIMSSRTDMLPKAYEASQQRKAAAGGDGPRRHRTGKRKDHRHL